MFASLHRWVQGILDANIAEPPKAALRCALVCNKTRCTPEEFKRCKARLDYVGLKRDN